MTIEQLLFIKSVYDGLSAGISNPININTAYGFLPNHSDGSPVRAKIQAITRFMMLSYYDHLAEVNKVVAPEPIVESIGTIENKPKQTHQESVDDDLGNIRGFLTAEQKEDLRTPLSNTTLEIISSDGKKKRTRKPNKKA
jgi:hypothetical protein